MKIVYLHQYYMTPEMAGGTRSYEMARRFAMAGHEVHVVTSRNPERKGLPRWSHERIGEVHVHWLPVAYDNKMPMGRRIFAFIQFALLAGWRAGKLRPDVVFATSTPLTIAIPAAVARWRHRAPVVFEVRDLWPELPIAIGVLRNPVAQFLGRSLERFAYRISREFIALSPGMADGIARLGVSRDRIHTIPNSCDNDIFDVPDSVGEEVKKSWPWAGDRAVVVYCGTLGRINDVGYLARLASAVQSRSSDIQFLVVGGGADEQNVRAEAESLGVLDSNFHMTGKVPKHHIPGIMNAATISSSLFMPLPEMESNSANKFFDSLAAGRPTMINYGGWQAEILKETGAGISVPGTDPEAAAEQIIEFVSNESQLLEAASAAKELAVTRFNRDILAKELLTVLERVGEHSTSNEQIKSERQEL